MKIFSTDCLVSPEDVRFIVSCSDQDRGGQKSGLFDFSFIISISHFLVPRRLHFVLYKNYAMAFSIRQLDELDVYMKLDLFPAVGSGPFFHHPHHLDPILRHQNSIETVWDISCGQRAAAASAVPAQPWFVPAAGRPPPRRPPIGRRHGPPTNQRPELRRGGGARRRPSLAPPSSADSVLSSWEQYSVNTVLDGFRRFYQRSNRLSCSSSLDVHSAKLR